MSYGQSTMQPNEGAAPPLSTPVSVQSIIALIAIALQGVYAASSASCLRRSTLAYEANKDVVGLIISEKLHLAGAEGRSNTKSVGTHLLMIAHISIFLACQLRGILVAGIYSSFLEVAQTHEPFAVLSRLLVNLSRNINVTIRLVVATRQNRHLVPTW